MPSAYSLALDKIEQSHAMVRGEIWHDDELALLFDLIEERLHELQCGARRKGPVPAENVMSIHPRQSEPANRTLTHHRQTGRLQR